MPTLRNGPYVLGWVTNGRTCENHHCLAAIAAGRPWHGTPAGHGATLNTYHYATRAEAEAAVYAAMRGRAGLRAA